MTEKPPEDVEAVRAEAEHTSVDLGRMLLELRPHETVNEEVRRLRQELRETADDTGIHTTPEESAMIQEGIRSQIAGVTKLKGIFLRSMRTVQISHLLGRMIKSCGSPVSTFSRIAIPECRDPEARRVVANLVVAAVIGGLRKAGTRIKTSSLPAAVTMLTDILLARSAQT